MPPLDDSPQNRVARFDRADFRARELPPRDASPPPVVAPSTSVEGTESRVARFDRADFRARAGSPPAVAPLDTAPGPEAAPESSDEPETTEGDKPEAEEEDKSAGTEPPYTGDALVAADHLRALGWPREKITMILRGPDSHSIHEIACPATSGSPLPEAVGKPTGEYGKEAPPLRATRNQANPNGVNQLRIVDAVAASLVGDKAALADLSGKLESLPGELQAYLAAAIQAGQRDKGAPARVEGSDALLGLAVNADGATDFLDLKRALVSNEVALLLPIMPRGTKYPFAPTLGDFAEAAQKLQLYRGMEQSLFVQTTQAAPAANG